MRLSTLICYRRYYIYIMCKHLIYYITFKSHIIINKYHMCAISFQKFTKYLISTFSRMSSAYMIKCFKKISLTPNFQHTYIIEMMYIFSTSKNTNHQFNWLQYSYRIYIIHYIITKTRNQNIFLLILVLIKFLLRS